MGGVDDKQGQEAETHFAVACTLGGRSVVAARPVTGRTHQIRIHLAEAGHPIAGDWLYSRGQARGRARAPYPLGLRAVALSYVDPFRRRPVRVFAPVDAFLATSDLRVAVVRMSLKSSWTDRRKLIRVELVRMIRDLGPCQKKLWDVD